MSNRVYQSQEHYKLAYDWAMHLRGDMQQKQIAKIVGVETSTIEKWFKRWDAPHSKPRKGRRSIPDETLDRAERMLDDGASYREVARTLNIGVNTVRNYFPGRGWSSEEIIDFAVTMRKFKRENKNFS